MIGLKSTRLNVGSGKNYLDTHINVDVNPDFNPDIESDIRNCNFDPESFTEILCNDIIEKLTLKDARMMFRRFHSWLKKNGTLQIHTMNLDFLVEILRTSSQKPERHEALKWLYATDGYDSAYWSNFVRWAYTKKSITEELTEADYHVIRCEVDCLGFGMKVLAVKR